MSFDRETALVIITSVFASTGFWRFIETIFAKKKEKESSENLMLRALAHDRIYTLGEEYIKRGYITHEEYNNLHEHLYNAYKAMGGNGTAEKIMKEVEKLPLKTKKEERRL